MLTHLEILCKWLSSHSRWNTQNIIYMSNVVCNRIRNKGKCEIMKNYYSVRSQKLVSSVTTDVDTSPWKKMSRSTSALNFESISLGGFNPQLFVLKIRGRSLCTYVCSTLKQAAGTTPWIWIFVFANLQSKHEMWLKILRCGEQSSSSKCVSSLHQK